MGWRGTLRSIEAASRRAAREEQRRQNLELKAQVAADAADAIQEWQSYIDSVQSFHLERLKDIIDWDSVRGRGEPKLPVLSSTFAKKPQSELDSFVPRWTDFLVGGSSRKRRSLVKKLEDAKQQDQALHQERLTEYEEALSNWELSGSILGGEPAAYVTALEQHLKNELPLKSLKCEFGEFGNKLFLEVLSDEIVPSYRLKQLRSGKLSETKMPKGDFNEIYSNYVAAIAIRLACDTFSILPVHSIQIDCSLEMLNPSSGHMEPTDILSVFFVRETLDKLNIDAIVPFDALKNFKHQKKYSRTKGFAPVEPLSL